MLRGVNFGIVMLTAPSIALHQRIDVSGHAGLRCIAMIAMIARIALTAMTAMIAMIL